jgi:1,4-dihydroxy-2-naphthoate octaprenyltransferase
VKTKLKAWVSAARLRTLPLSVSGIIVGASLAVSQGYSGMVIIILCIFTTISYQVLSNFANDYGDGLKGTDNEDRIGPVRALQSGIISPKEMKFGINITVALSIFLTVCLINFSFSEDMFFQALFFLVLGVIAVIAAIKYTVGKSAYGYKGFGDVFVFIFFGLVSVMGSHFLLTKQWNWLLLLPATSIGLLSVGVLNLNNMRDIGSDIKAGKITLVVKIGSKMARFYHNNIVILAMLLAMVYTVLNYKSPFNFLYLIAFIPLIMHLIRVNRIKDPKQLDPELKKLALSTFLFALLFALSVNIIL